MQVKSRFNSAVLLLVFTICSNLVTAQKLDSLLYKLDAKYPQEKIYLHYDRPYYNAGETIWFKAYLTSNNLPSTISKTLYAELIGDKGKVLQKKMMPVVEAGAASFFDLPDSINSSVVYIRAYTAWMLNFDSTFQYIKPINIISAGGAAKKNIPATNYTLTFFPEGGDLVSNVETRLAFKATDQDGNPINVKGNIVDKKAVKVIGFESIHNGMGAFAFKPKPDETYKAIWKDKKGIAHETALPAAKKNTVSLSVNNIKNNVTYTLKRPDSVDLPNSSFFVIAQIQQQIIYSARINLMSKKEITAPLPVDSLANGIVQLTVFNADEIPVAERIFFVNNDSYYFNTDLHAVELNLTKRQHNTLQVDVGGSIVTNLSISVTDESLSVMPVNRDNIYSNILLTSDLKGYVFNPAYYFSSEEDSVAQQLDLVMLTNGWRRFKWEDLVANKWPVVKFQPEDFISINGNVYGPSPMLLKGREVTGILKTKSGDDVFAMPVNKDGQFGVTGISFYDTAKLYYQFNQDKDKQLTSSSSFTIRTSFANATAPVAIYLNSLSPSPMPDSSTLFKNKKIAKLISEEFKEGKIIKSLETVTVKSSIKTREQILDEKYASGFFTGTDAYVFAIEDDPLARSALTVLDYLKSRVAGMIISTNGNPTVTWRGNATSVFLNESTSDLSMVQGISMNDVAMIKVFRPPFFSSTSGGTGGAIAVYTKKGEAGSAATKGLDFVRLNGYSSYKEFYSPDYEKLADRAPENDFRTTLYWNPFLLLDQNKRRIKIPFYNSDNCKKIRVIIEGMNKEGQLSREEKVFE